MKRRWAVVALCAVLTMGSISGEAVNTAAGETGIGIENVETPQDLLTQPEAEGTAGKVAVAETDMKGEMVYGTEEDDREIHGENYGERSHESKNPSAEVPEVSGDETGGEKEKLTGEEKTPAAEKENETGTSFRTPEEIGFLPLAEMENCWVQEGGSGRKRGLLLQGSAPLRAATFGSSANISLGSEVSYPYTDNITHYFFIEYGTLRTTGFCGASSKFGQAGNYAVQYLNEGAGGSMSYQTATMIKMVMLMYPLFSQNIYNEAMQREAGNLPLLRTDAYRGNMARRFVGIHAIVSYLNSGDVYGLTDDEKREVSAAASTLQAYVNNRPDLVAKAAHFRLYRSAPEDSGLQSVLWLVPDAHIQILKTGVNASFREDSSLWTYAGAEYGVYSSLKGDGRPDPDTKMDTITLDQSGFGKTEDSFRYIYGKNYYVQEEKAPAGYLLNPAVLTCRATDRKADQDGDGKPDPSGRGDYIGGVTDKERCATGIRFVKVGETRNHPVEGARFRITFTGREKHGRTWIFRTGKDGELDLTKAEDYLEADSPDELYMDDVSKGELSASGKAVFLPGSYVMREISAPEGYEVLDQDFTAEVVEDDNAPGGAVWKWSEKSAGEFQEIVIDGKNAGRGLKDPEIPDDIEMDVNKSVNRVSNHIGQIQTWTIRTEIKGRLCGRDREVFEIRDSFDAEKKRLDYMGNVRVSAEGIDEKLTGDDYRIKESPAGTPGGSLTVSFTASGRKKLGTSENPVVIVKADTRINANTGFGEEKASIPNQAEIYYDNGRMKLELPSNQVHVYTGRIGIQKKDSNGQTLAGVGFALYTQKDGAYYPVIRKDGKILTDREEGYDPGGEVLSVVTDEKGEAEFAGLGEDDVTKSRTYYLKETKTAKSYALIGDYIPVEMSRGLVNGGKTLVVMNDPLLTLYAGGCGRAIVMVCAFIGVIFCALMWKRRKMKMNCSNRAM